MSKMVCGGCGKRADFFSHVCEECWHSRVSIKWLEKWCKKNPYGSAYDLVSAARRQAVDGK